MVPESVAALYGFLGLITPGLVYQLLRERAWPAVEETSFREASRIALTSLLFTTCSLLSFGALSMFRSHWLADPGQWLRQGDAYVAVNAGLVARTVIFVVTLSCVYAWLASRLVNVVTPRIRHRIVKTSVWYQLFVEDVPPGMAPWVTLRLSDETQLWGYVDFFTVGQGMDDRELSLIGPGLSSKSAQTDDPKREEYWQRIAVRGTDISVMKVAYQPARVKPRRTVLHKLASLSPTSDP